MLEPLEDRALLTPFTVEGPGVNPADFRITTFAAGLNYPAGMIQLSDGSVLVATSPPVSGSSSYYNSTGRLVRLVDADGDGVADGPGTVLASGLPGSLTGLQQAGPYIIATSSSPGASLGFLHVGATPASPLTLAGSVNLSFPSPWEHTSYGLAVRPTPGQSGSYDVLFNDGSQYNGITTDSHGNIIPQPTTGTVTASGLISGSLNGDSIYMVTLRDSNGTPVLSNLRQVATGLRNAASMAFDPATGDLLLADNGMDGIPDPTEAYSADTLQRISSANIGVVVPNFGFPYTYTLTTTTPGGTGTRVNPSGGVTPLAAFEPLVDPLLPTTGSESEGSSGFAPSPINFPTVLQHGVFIGFHGQFSSGGVANEENPLLFANPSNGNYFDFISNDLPNIGHFDGAMSTADSLFLSDIAPGGSVFSQPGQGVIYQIKAITSPTPTPTPTPPPPPNQPPAFPPGTTIADKTVNEGAELSFTAPAASDPDGDAITYGLGPGAPPGAAIDPHTGQFTWTPDPYASWGDYSIAVVATDDGSPPLSAALPPFNVHVLPVNHAPVLTPIPGQLAEQGQPTAVRVARYASDPDRPAQALTYSLAAGAPAGAILDPASGLFAWTVPPGQPVGTYSIGVTVTDDGRFGATQLAPMSTSGTFTIDVVPFNHQPVVAPIPAQTLDEGNPLTVSATATDSDAGQTITYSLGPGAPAGAAIDAHSGVFTWTPDPYAGAGNYAITVVATDNGPIPKSGSATFAVDVRAVNHPPVFAAAIPVQLVSPGRTLQFGVAGFTSDLDRPAQALRYGLAPGDPAGASIDPVSGVFTWALPPSQHIGSYSFGIVVTDSGSPPLSQATSFVVDVVDNGPATTVAKAKVSRRRGLAITLRFSQPLDPSTAGNPDDYILVPAGKKKGPSAAGLPLVVGYNAATRTVTLTAQAKVRRGQALRLTVIGGGPDGLAKVTGLPLAGDGRHVGTNYLATIKGLSIKHTNAAPGKSRGKAASSRAISRDAAALPHARRSVTTVHPAGPSDLARGTPRRR